MQVGQRPLADFVTSKTLNIKKKTKGMAIHTDTLLYTPVQRRASLMRLLRYFLGLVVPPS